MAGRTCVRHCGMTHKSHRTRARVSTKSFELGAGIGRGGMRWVRYSLLLETLHLLSFCLGHLSRFKEGNRWTAAETCYPSDCCCWRWFSFLRASFGPNKGHTPAPVGVHFGNTHLSISGILHMYTRPYNVNSKHSTFIQKKKHVNHRQSPGKKRKKRKCVPKRNRTRTWCGYCRGTCLIRAFCDMKIKVSVSQVCVSSC